MEQKISGLIGRKLGHSYSVPIHRALGNPDYRLYELEPEQLERFLQNPCLSGVNVTIPYKQAVIPFCGRLSPEAQAMGSVNTIVREPDGTLCGHNTDAYGFRYMASRAGVDFRDAKVLIFGSGGASATVHSATAGMGARQVVTISRRGPDNYENLSRHRDAEILINATPLGMYPQPGPFPADPGEFPGCRAVLDLVYNPLRTGFMLRAEALNIPHANGLSMLVAQAKRAAELFTGKDIPEERIEEILSRLYHETENIVLIGMPGCGKSTVGALLGELSGRPAVDVDAEIVKAAEMPIPDIFAAGGEARFRALETEQLARFGKEKGQILITGGGAVTQPGNYPLLHQNGRIYHLTRSLDQLPREGRPLSADADLEAMYALRLPLYASFRDAEADNNGSPRETADRIWREFCENPCD